MEIYIHFIKLSKVVLGDCQQLVLAPFMCCAKKGLFCLEQEVSGDFKLRVVPSMRSFASYLQLLLLMGLDEIYGVCVQLQNELLQLNRPANSRIFASFD